MLLDQISCTADELLLYYRGQKWNPLRLRLDSYDYTVKQHVVGSLLLAPLLLLLPTTSVFYIFFTMMSTYASLVRISLEVLISFIHATPFFSIFIWLLRPARFPAGLWFEIDSFKSNAINLTDDYYLSQDGLSPDRMNKCGDGSRTMLSFLHSNCLSIGERLRPTSSFLLLLLT